MSAELESLKALGQFPIIQAALFIVIVGGGALATYMGLREKKPINNNAAPQWTLYGPAHDVMSAIHEMNEQSRELNNILRRVEETLKSAGKAQWEACISLKRMEELAVVSNRDSREQTLLMENLFNSLSLRGEMPRRR